MFPAINMQLLLSGTLIALISSFALETDFHHLAPYISIHTPLANVND